MSDTNNRNKQGPGLQDVREGGGPLPDAGMRTGLDASYPNLAETVSRLGSVSADSDAPSPSKDMPNPAEKLSGGSHDSAMGGLGTFDAGSSPINQTRGSKQR